MPESITTIDAQAVRERADRLRAIKFQEPLGVDSCYGAAYEADLTTLVAGLLMSLGDTAGDVADTLRAAGVTGHTTEGRMVGEHRPPRLNPVSAWLHSLLGPGHYQACGDGYLVDLETPGDTQDANTIPMPDAVQTFLDGIEDPFDDEIHRYRGLTVNDDGLLAIYIPVVGDWVCAAIPEEAPTGICGLALPCPRHLTRPEYTDHEVLTSGVTEGWADTETDPALIDWPARQAAALITFTVVDGRPVNPVERTNVARGRNGLGLWGESKAADAIVTATDGAGRRWLVLVERGDGFGWALPGGMVDQGEDPAAAGPRELAEETGLTRPGAAWRIHAPRYVPDPRASAEAWVVTAPCSLDLGTMPEQALPSVTGADDAKRAAWVHATSYDTLIADLQDRFGGQLFRAHHDLLRELLAEPVPGAKTLAGMTAEVATINQEKGWRTGDNTFGDYIALLHSEASEALEAYRDRRLTPYTTPAGKPDDVGSELADVLIRLLDMCDVYSIDLAAEYARKIAYNRTRPYQHGGRTLADTEGEGCPVCGAPTHGNAACSNRPAGSPAGTPSCADLAAEATAERTF